MIIPSRAYEEFKRLMMKFMRFRLLPYIVIVAGVGISVGLFLFVERQLTDQVESRLDRRSEQIAIGLQQSIDAKIQVLQAFDAFYSVELSINRTEFNKFSIVTLTYHPDIQALEWLPQVTAARREQVEAAARADGLVDYAILEYDADGSLVPAGDRDRYFPVYFIEPLAGNEAALGFDLASEPTRAEALTRAESSGRPAATTPIRLVQEQGDQLGVLLFQPIYNEQTDFIGVILVVLRLGDFVQSALQEVDTSGFNIFFYDADTTDYMRYDQQSIIHLSPAEQLRPADTLIVEQRLQLAGREWTMQFNVSDAYIASQTSGESWVFLGSGLLITVLVLIYWWQQGRAQQALQRYADELKTVNGELEAYNYTIAHDLKSPLSVVVGYVELTLTESGLPPVASEYLGRVQAVSLNMVRMIDQLLYLTQVREETAPRDTVYVSQVLDAVALRFDNDRAAIQFPTDLPPAWGHAPWLEEVFANLISNALKYRHPDRAPHIQIRAAVNGTRVRYEVIDNGVGINPQDRQRIFDKFTRLHNPLARNAGFGLGLSIVQRIIARLEGELGVESVDGEGATFWLELPRPPYIESA